MPYANVLKQYTFSDMLVEYLQAGPDGLVGLRIYPAALANQLTERREYLFPERANGPRAWNVESLVQFKLIGDETDGYQQGLSLRNSLTLKSLRFESQREETVTTGGGTATTVITRLVSERGFACEHHLTCQAGRPGFSLH